MIEWLESTSQRRLPGMAPDKWPADGEMRLRPLSRSAIGDGRTALVDWPSGGWTIVDDDDLRRVEDTDGRPAASIDPSLAAALWRRGLITIDGDHAYDEERFHTDLSNAREYYTLVYLLSPGCNLVCTYCYLGHETPRHSGQFQVEEATSLLDQALELDYPGVLVDFGEFAVAKELFVELLDRFRRRARERGVPIWFSAQTNGTTLDADLCRRIAGDDLLLSISLDGPAELHDLARTFRNGAGSYEAARWAIALAQRAGIRTNLIATIGRHNVAHPREVVETLLEQQPDRYLLKPVLAHGEAEPAWSEVGITEAEYARFTADAFDAGIAHGVAGLDQTALKFLLRLVGSPTGWRDACTSRWCGSGRDLHVVAADGAVHSCPRFVDAPSSDAAAPAPVAVTLSRRRPVLADDLLDGALRHPHASCDRCRWYRSCGGGCTLAGGVQGKDPNCESHAVLLDRLMTTAVPRLINNVDGATSSLGIAVRRQATAEVQV